jgi:hypothetical protein
MILLVHLVRGHIPHGRIQRPHRRIFDRSASGCNWYRIANKPLANEAPPTALCTDRCWQTTASLSMDESQTVPITHAGILPGILLEKDECKDAAFGIADMRTAFQKISRPAVWEVPLPLCYATYRTASTTEG